MTKKLIKNKWKCLYCNDIIESKHQHHFISCKCGKTSIDGGTSYIRRVYVKENKRFSFLKSRFELVGGEQ